VAKQLLSVCLERIDKAFTSIASRSPISAALWHIARWRQTAADMVRYQALLENNANDTLSDAERAELTQLRIAADRFMLRKEQAAALLRWRGHHIPPADKL